MNRNELLARAAELADLLVQAPEIARYRQAEAAMNRNPAAVSKIRRLRELQEQVGEFMARGVPEVHYRHLGQEIESLFAELEKIPEVREFMDAQSAVNDLLQDVTGCLAKAVTEPPDLTDSPRTRTDD
ncbi:MAG: YlbF family regulator [Alicyclobacillaceae bacterium]|nr:YlbF family regulator [Alicyclobacillaceae bacterium]